MSDGLTLDNFETYVYIIGFNHNETLGGNGITFQGFKTAKTGGTDICLVDSEHSNDKTSGQWFNMNNSNTNTGGWKDSLMRTVTMPLIKSVLPSDLKSIIKSTYKYTDNVGGGSSVEANVSVTQDEVFLLSEYEIFGVKKFANNYETNKQAQYNYYVLGNSKIKYAHDNSSSYAIILWERSPTGAYSTAFCNVGVSGTAIVEDSHRSQGVAPAFVV